jgi:hypothetical protein
MNEKDTQETFMAATNSRPRPARISITDLSQYGSTTENLPYWARSTNPIVRRHLGLYWRTVPPEMRPFYIMYGTWVVLMVICVAIPPLFGFTMISFLASIMIVPLTMLLYAHVLLHVAIESARTMQQEISNNTFMLLQATPMSLQQVFLGKVAAAMWRRMDDLVMIAQIALVFSPPLLFTVYSDLWKLEGAGLFVAPTMTLLATLVVTIRIILEPIMIGVLSVFIGLVMEGRSRAITAAVFLGSFYFILLNLLSRLPAIRGYETANGMEILPNKSLVVLMDFVLPIVLPLLIIVGLLKLAERVVTSD